MHKTCIKSNTRRKEKTKYKKRTKCSFKEETFEAAFLFARVGMFEFQYISGNEPEKKPLGKRNFIIIHDKAVTL